MRTVKHIQVKDFENDMHILEEEGLITLQWKYNTIVKICACENKFQDYYKKLDRKEKKDLIKEEKEFYLQWEEYHLPILSRFCKEQIERIDSDKKPEYERKTAEDILKFLKFMETNKEDVLEREASILVFHDSKLLKEKYHSRICSIIQRYAHTDEDEKIMLENYHIYENYSYIYVKGRAEISFSTGDRIQVMEGPIGLSSGQIKNITSFIIKDTKIVTVENLTSFQRIKEEDCFYLFLSGYHNSAKENILHKIWEDNNRKQWYHFGDLDPDGFYILENLKKGTGIQFEPLYMGIEELQQFLKYTKSLEKNDIIKAENLIQRGKYKEILEYMLKNNCKLEQEIISLKFK